MIESALDNYREAMALVESYLDDPKDDYEGRRLKTAQWSLEQARKRAELYIDKLPNAKNETCEAQKTCEAEYMTFAADAQSSVALQRPLTNNDLER